jgi:hypothetical protein
VRRSPRLRDLAAEIQPRLMLVVKRAVNPHIVSCGRAPFGKGLQVVKLQKHRLLTRSVGPNIAAAIAITSDNLAAHGVGNVPRAVILQ